MRSEIQTGSILFPKKESTHVSNRSLKLLSIVIPARDEEGCIASTIEHLHLELKLREVPHEIIVVDDGSSDRTWEILRETSGKIMELRPIRNR